MERMVYMVPIAKGLITNINLHVIPGNVFFTLLIKSL